MLQPEGESWRARTPALSTLHHLLSCLQRVSLRSILWTVREGLHLEAWDHTVIQIRRERLSQSFKDRPEPSDLFHARLPLIQWDVWSGELKNRPSSLSVSVQSPFFYWLQILYTCIRLSPDQFASSWPQFHQIISESGSESTFYMLTDLN